jgi:hypothetical protein
MAAARTVQNINRHAYMSILKYPIFCLTAPSNRYKSYLNYIEYFDLIKPKSGVL